MAYTCKTFLLIPSNIFVCIHLNIVRFLAPLLSVIHMFFLRSVKKHILIAVPVLYNDGTDYVFKSDCLSHFAPHRNVASHRCFPLIYSSFFFARPLF